MNKREAYRAMLDGYKICHEQIDDEYDYFYFDEEENNFCIAIENNIIIGLDDSDICYDDGYFIKKQTKTYWLWVDKNNGDLIPFFLDSKGFTTKGKLHNYFDQEDVKCNLVKLEWSKVEL